MSASILVVGGGAIGGVTAARLVEEGVPGRVCVLDANPEHAALMRDPGLELDRLGQRSRVRIESFTDASALDQRFDFALLTLKAPYLEDALDGLLERDAAQSYVSLGNGLVQDRVVGKAGAEKTLAGTVEWGGTNLGPGRLAQTTRAPFVLGELDGKVRERTEALADTLEAAFEVRITRNLQAQIWSKLLLNSAFSGLGVVSGLLYREIAADPGGREAAYGLWREGYEVGLAQGLELEEVVGVEPADLAGAGDDRTCADAALETAMSHVGATKASMLQDIERGMPTEVDVINGGVVQRGSAHGVPTPLNQRVVELVHAMERGELEPSPRLFEEVLAAVDAG